MAGLDAVVVVAVIVDAEDVVDAVIERLSKPVNHFTIQWHVTDACNRRCRHCYQDSYKANDLPIEQMIYHLEKIAEFIWSLKQLNNNFHAHINITGGEPFLYPKLLILLKEIRNKKIFSFGILSNGHMLDDNSLNMLNLLRPSFIQLSLDGNKTINDQIRGNGAFEETLSAITVYKKMKIPLLLSFTANAINYSIFNDVAHIAQKFGVSKLWTDRYLPLNKDDTLLMGAEQARAYFRNIASVSRKKYSLFSPKTKISCDRSLQFLETGGVPYSCQAGKTLLTLMPNGDVYPCRRMPVFLGNINSTPLNNIYVNHPVLVRLRSNHLSDPSCQNCFYSKSCNGGLKCLSYALHGDFTGKDPHCWIE